MTSAKALMVVVFRFGPLFGLSCTAIGSESESNPMTVDVVYTADVLSNLSGGVRRDSAYLDNLDVIIDIDADELWGLRNTQVFFYGLYNNGTKFSEVAVGDFQVVSNIETGVRAVRLYEAWFNVGIGASSEFLLGLYDLNSEFDVLETAQLFMNSAHGIGTDISQAGLNGPSIFPVTGLSARYAAKLGDDWKLKLAILDGVPGDPEDPGATTIRLGADEGALLIGELHWQDTHRRALFGIWGYTAKFSENPLGGGGLESGEGRGNAGFYVRGETVVSGAVPSLSVFGRYGYATGDFNLIEHFISAGAVWRSVLPNRYGDELGIAVAWSEASENARNLGERLGTSLDSREIVIEATYRTPILDRFSLQPNIQYVINPGLDPALDNSLIAGLRFELDVW